jgi:hypothetical protein
VVYQDPAHIRTLRTFLDFPTPLLQHAFSFPTMQVQTQEARIILAIEAIQTSRRKLSRRKATTIYEVPESILRLRINGHTSIRDRRPANHNLTELEETIIINHILDRDSRGFPPR